MIRLDFDRGFLADLVGPGPKVKRQRLRQLSRADLATLVAIAADALELDDRQGGTALDPDDRAWLQAIYKAVGAEETHRGH